MSEQAKRAAQNSVRDVETEFRATSEVADLAVTNAPIAAPSIDAFQFKWSDSVKEHLGILDAAATAIAVVADSLIETDSATASELTPGLTPGPTARDGPR